MNKELEIFEHFKDIEYPRIERKKLHSLTDILLIGISAVFCGADNWNEIVTFGKAKEEWLRTFLELKNAILSHDTFNRVFSRNAIEGKFGEAKRRYSLARILLFYILSLFFVVLLM